MPSRIAKQKQPAGSFGV